METVISYLKNKSLLRTLMVISICTKECKMFFTYTVKKPTSFENVTFNSICRFRRGFTDIKNSLFPSAPPRQAEQGRRTTHRPR